MRIDRFPFFCAIVTVCFTNGVYAQNTIHYEPVHLTSDEKKILGASLDKIHERYDPREKMLTKALTGYNYHTDAESGVFHEVRNSLTYAVGLLDLNEAKYEQRAFDLIEKTITLQDTVSGSKTKGIWPYYLEEPLATKKSPADWNWADFNGVSLLDVYMGHGQKLSPGLKSKIKQSLILAAQSIQKRDVQPGYTNIAIMGTYVTYMTSHLFDLPEMQAYATARLDKFYKYTLERGFTEYNSPTYTVVALDELERMKRHIAEPEASKKVKELYDLSWEVVARHFHKPSGQWAGPHSRSYNSLMTGNIYGLLKQASAGRIELPGASPRTDVKIKHRIPEHLLPYFLNPQLPRLQTDAFTIDEPRVIGTTWLTPEFALSTANRSSLWNQRRPFLAYWGTAEKPHYLQLKFLHDLYDFSSASFYSAQKENSVIGAVSFITNGGDKHISIDRIKDGKFRAKDLRLRFEMGNQADLAGVLLPSKASELFTFTVDGMSFGVQLLEVKVGNMQGHWEKGGDGKNSWLDFVLYAGAEQNFDLAAMEQAILAFTFEMTQSDTSFSKAEVKQSLKEGNLQVTWKGLTLTAPIKPMMQPKNL